MRQLKQTRFFASCDFFDKKSRFSTRKTPPRKSESVAPPPGGPPAAAPAGLAKIPPESDPNAQSRDPSVQSRDSCASDAIAAIRSKAKFSPPSSIRRRPKRPPFCQWPRRVSRRAQPPKAPGPQVSARAVRRSGPSARRRQSKNEPKSAAPK